MAKRATDKSGSAVVLFPVLAHVDFSSLCDASTTHIFLYQFSKYSSSIILLPRQEKRPSLDGLKKERKNII